MAKIRGSKDHRFRKRNWRQVNGKLRGTILIHTDDEEEIIKQKAFEQENVKKYIEGKRN